MTERKKRLMQRIFALAGILLASALAAAAVRPIREQWLLGKLASAEPETREAATIALGAMGSIRALPTLLQDAEPDPVILFPAAIFR